MWVLQRGTSCSQAWAGSEWCWCSPLAPASPFCPLALKMSDAASTLQTSQPGAVAAALSHSFLCSQQCVQLSTAQVGLTPGLCFCSVVSSWTQVLCSEGCQGLTTGQIVTAKPKSLLSTKRKQGGTEPRVQAYPCNKINNWRWDCSVPSLESHAQWAKLSTSRQM